MRIGTEDKTDATDIANERGLVRSVCLPTQLSHVNVDEIGFRNELVVPHLRQDGCACQQLVASLHHVLEQMKLAWPQIDPTVAALRGSIQEIELQRSHTQHGV